MGGRNSTSSCGSCNGKNNVETISSAHMGVGSLGRRNRKKLFAKDLVGLQQLASTPSRIFTNGKGRTSCIYTQQGLKGVNQDAMIVWEDFMAEDVTLCGVFDGHGPDGHLVARKIRDALPIKLLSFWYSYQSKQNDFRTAWFKNANDLHCMDTEKEGSDYARLITLWKEAYLKTYSAMDKELKSHPNMDCFCSGSTAVTIVKQGSNLFMGYIGDSRAILGAKDDNDSLVAIQLTVDLKPDLPMEAERIKSCKGRVFALEDEPDVPRVWLPNDFAPGLAMARAFGDFCVKKYGVISVPEFSHRTLTDRDQFVVLATDGIWDVLSNDEVVQIVVSAPNRSSAARILVDSAAREWKIKYPTSKMDDCAVVCLFLNGNMDMESDNDEACFSSATLQRSLSTSAVESDESQISEPSLTRNFTVRSSETNGVYGKLLVDSEGGNNVEAEDQSWTGLEGLIRSNSLVHLPRFPEEKQAA